MSCGTCETPQEGELIGKVSHYFDRAGVAILELAGTLKVGDTIRIVGGGKDFTQVVDSMEVEHQKIQSAKKGDSLGLKVSQEVKEGYKVYKL
jgi:putative protease